MNKYSKSKSSLFLMELILTVLLFAICSAICMKLFAASHQLGVKTWELNKSVATAQSFAEVMRGTNGSIDEIIKMYPSAVKSDDSYFEVFYDADFNECDFHEAVYVSDVNITINGSIEDMDIRIIRKSDSEEIYSLLATKYIDRTEGWQ